MMGVPIEGATNIFCDNRTVCNSAQKQDTRLNKKDNAINFHRIRESVAGKWCRIAFKPDATNLLRIFSPKLYRYLNENNS